MSQDTKTSSRLFPSVRLLVIVIVFIGNSFGNIGFSLLNFTIVCMVNSSSTHDCSSEFIYESDVAKCYNKSHEHSDNAYFGDIPWTRQQQGNILAAFSWGIVFFALPAGIMMDIFGVKVLFALGNLINCLSLVLTPAAAYMGEWWLFVLRFIVGLTGGMFWPTIMASCSRWSPKQEAGFLLALCASGFPVGAFISNLASGGFCSMGPGGWQYAYYFWGALNLVYVIVFCIVYTDNPRKNRFISDTELDYLLMNRAISQKKEKKSIKDIPWFPMFTSLPVLAAMLTNFTDNYCYYLVTMFQPTYIKEVLLADPKMNGLFSALPPMVLCLGRLGFGHLSDRIRFLKPNFSVRLFEFLSNAVMCLCFVLITFFDSSTSELAIACLVIALFFHSLNSGGYIKSMAMVAPAYIGVISGVGETLSGGSSLVVPYVVAALTVEQTREEWSTVFFITAATGMVGALFFAAFGTAEEQGWAKARKSGNDNVFENNNASTNKAIIYNQMETVTDKRLNGNMKAVEEQLKY